MEENKKVDTIFICTDATKRNEVMKLMDQDTLPYVTMAEDLDYESAVLHVDGIANGCITVTKEVFQDLGKENTRLSQQVEDYRNVVKKMNKMDLFFGALIGFSIAFVVIHVFA